MTDRATAAGTRSEGCGRVGRFALVGVANTAIDFVGFGLLMAAGLPLLLANFLSTSAGLAFGFFAHSSFSFRSERPRRETAIPFLLTSAFALWVLQPLVIWSVAGLLAHLWDAGSLTSVWIPKACAIGLALVWNFSLYHFVVFRTAERERP